ncbi:hypothetical protein [Shouchella clausii]|uniref:hypothetical protein n=1 Tax=Shouchella clausii TaxID=79880 RepID=UPI00211C3807|nr:hypothetical protein [Shouchella clausii]MCY1103967.1 hypothetical protein [Shouchella clausii]
MKAKMGESVQLQTRRNKAAKSTLTWYLFLLPTLLGIACFILYPVFESFRLSFYRSNDDRDVDRFRQLSACPRLKCILECGLQYVLYCFFSAAASDSSRVCPRLHDQSH